MIDREKKIIKKIKKEIDERFDSERACRKYLKNKRWPKTHKCPKCKHEHFYIRKLNRHIFYQCKECKCERALTSGTIFERSQVPLIDWFKMIRIVVLHQDVRTKTLQKYFKNISDSTVRRIREKIEVNLLKENAYKIFIGLIEDGKLERAKRRILKDKPELKKKLKREMRKKEK